MLGAALWGREARTAWVPMGGSSVADAAWPAPRCGPKTPMPPSRACRQQQQETAARLCMLEGVLLDAEDVFMEQANPTPNPNPNANPNPNPNP